MGELKTTTQKLIQRMHAIHDGCRSSFWVAIIFLVNKFRIYSFFPHLLIQKTRVLWWSMPMFFPVFLKPCRRFMGMVIGRMDGMIGGTWKVQVIPVKTGPEKRALLNERWMSCLLSKLRWWLLLAVLLSFLGGASGRGISSPGLKSRWRKWRK